MEVADSVNKIMVELEADPALFNGPANAETEASVRKSIETATTEKHSLLRLQLQLQLTKQR